ncbi:MAG: CheR family methyltransferase [Aureliella sp.]
MAIKTQDLEYLQDVVARRSANKIAPRQSQMLEQQLTTVAVENGLKDVETLIAELRRVNNPKLQDKVAEAATINETQFFRDVHPFESLKNSIIPELMQRNSATRQFRIWCAACSSGQEPYSIAMTILEHFPQLKDWNISILATDISHNMVRRTQEGNFSQLEVNRGMPPQKLVRFFDRSGTSWKVKSELSQLITTRQLNLAKPWPFLGQFDVIFIRNVLIYFEQSVKVDILKRMRGNLRDQGYLFLGGPEMLLGLGLPYERQEIDASVCYRPN